MKILGFIFLLLVVLYFSRNQEGYNDNQINEDIKEFNDLYDQATNPDKSKSTTPLRDLKFKHDGAQRGQKLDDLILKYSHSNNNKDVSDTLTLDGALKKLRYRRDSE